MGIPASRDRRPWLLSGIAVGAVLALARRAPIVQDPRYLVFADTRTILGVPNFWNVVSNAAFLLVGAGGVGALLLGRRRSASSDVPPTLRLAYGTLFAAVILVAFGSSWFHLRPDEASLVWDRLPMTVAFMAFFAIVLGERVAPRVGRLALVPLVLAGLASIARWKATGDLRLYVLVQYLPFLLVPLVLVLYRAPAAEGGWIWGVALAYVVAKALELFDRPIYEALGFVSGHTLKHVAAAAGTWLIVARVRRKPAAPARGD